jgi:hypothetical protein
MPLPQHGAAAHLVRDLAKLIRGGAFADLDTANDTQQRLWESVQDRALYMTEGEG